MLFSPEAHEPLTDEAWSAARARAAIAAIVADAEEAFDDGWRTHPDDVEEPGDEAVRFRTIYMGGAGVVDAFRRLSTRGFVELRRDYVPYLEQSLEAPPDFASEHPERSVWMGETAIRLVLQRLAPSQANLARLAELIEPVHDDDRIELMWGAPGTILAGRELGLDVDASVEWLRAQRDDDRLWTQVLEGKARRYIGPVHGFATCARVLGEDATETLQRYAVHEDGLVNWPGVAGHELDANGDKLIRTQWCHGAPGMVATLAHLMDEELALAGGELTWCAGPVRKGSGLCHGTAGNGYAFLALLERTGDERWLARAQAFAVHAAAQVERTRAQHGHGRYTLWTGDLGAALFLADCVDGGGRLPIP